MKSIFKLNNVNELDDAATWGKLLTPVYAYLELTKKCNCNCDFCQVDNLHSKNSDINLHLFKKIIKQLKQNHILEVRLGGGEPLTATNFKSMVNFLYKNNIMFWVCTNGILLTKEIAISLKHHGCIGVRVSIDSHIESKHNEIRKNSNAYKKAWEAIENAKYAGLIPVVSMTVGNHNIKDVTLLESLSSKKGAHFITHPIMPIGRGVQFLSKGNYFCCSDEVKDIISKSTGEKHCVAGTEMIAIDSLGFVSPCTFIKPKLSMKKYSLRKILNHSEFLKYKYPIEKSIVCNDCKNKTNNTKNCRYSDLCRGGCWALKEINDEN